MFLKVLPRALEFIRLSSELLYEHPHSPTKYYHCPTKHLQFGLRAHLQAWSVLQRRSTALRIISEPFRTYQNSPKASRFSQSFSQSFPASTSFPSEHLYSPQTSSRDLRLSLHSFHNSFYTQTLPHRSSTCFEFFSELPLTLYIFIRVSLHAVTFQQSGFTFLILSCLFVFVLMLSCVFAGREKPATDINLHRHLRPSPRPQHDPNKLQALLHATNISLSLTKSPSSLPNLPSESLRSSREPSRSQQNRRRSWNSQSDEPVQPIRELLAFPQAEWFRLRGSSVPLTAGFAEPEPEPEPEWASQRGARLPPSFTWGWREKRVLLCQLNHM